MYELLVEKRAARFIAKLPERERKIIFSRLDLLKLDPYDNSLDIKKLKGRKGNDFRIRIKNYRIIYSIRKNELLILVIDAGLRKDIYR